MKTLNDSQLGDVIGRYTAPAGIYSYIKSVPFLGTVTNNVTSLVAGQCTELTITYTVGGSGLADGAWIKGTFKFYSDWALFQTSDPKADNYVSAEYIATELLPGQTTATVQELAVRFDQKGHERPFQKAIIVDIVDGYLNPGDRIVLRLGDKRGGARGTRVQTFVEEQFAMRWYIDPIGTSRFAAIKPDILFDIIPGPVHRLQASSPRLVRPGAVFVVHTHAEDQWGNAVIDVADVVAILTIRTEDEVVLTEKAIRVSHQGWTAAAFEDLKIGTEGDFVITVVFRCPKFENEYTITEYISSSASCPVPRVLFADLHVHSDDTVGTNSTRYNFSYAQHIAGLDIVGYTANDFNIVAERWAATLELIRNLNISEAGNLLIFPGTEWCGNSAAGGDHNVVFLGDPILQVPEFPLDRAGNVARSFEWNEDGPADLVPGAWPLDELYATYAHDPDSHLLIPHVGGRRCNLGWHHPKLERLIEIGSAWGEFEWLLRDALQRGYKLGVCANSDEHRGRCGGGVPGTAVFGVKGGLTGVLAERVDRGVVGRALRARRTFATTGQRLVGLLKTAEGAVQGDEILVKESHSVEVKYAFFGSSGFSCVEAFDATGLIFRRDLWREGAAAIQGAEWNTLRITWGGARLYDRYREAVWDGTITTEGGEIRGTRVFGGIMSIPEGENVTQTGSSEVVFHSRTSGDFDGVHLSFAEDSKPSKITVSGTMGGYVKVGNPLNGNPHKPQSTFSVDTTWEIALQPGGHVSQIKGGAELSVRVEVIPTVNLPRRAEGSILVDVKKDEEQAIYFVGREWDGGKVITSPLFFTTDV